MKRDDEDFPDWFKKMIEDEEGLHYENDYVEDDTPDVSDEELEDDEYHVTIVAELYDKSDEFIDELGREDIGILCQDEIDEAIEKIKTEEYSKLAQKELLDLLNYKFIDAFVQLEKRSHGHLLMYFQHKVDKL